MIHPQISRSLLVFLLVLSLSPSGDAFVPSRSAPRQRYDVSLRLAPLQPYIEKLNARRALTADEAKSAHRIIIRGSDRANEGEFLKLLYDKGETKAEEEGFIEAMIEAGAKGSNREELMADTARIMQEKLFYTNVEANSTLAFYNRAFGSRQKLEVLRLYKGYMELDARITETMEGLRQDITMNLNMPPFFKSDVLEEYRDLKKTRVCMEDDILPSAGGILSSTVVNDSGSRLLKEKLDALRLYTEYIDADTRMAVRLSAIREDLSLVDVEMTSEMEADLLDEYRDLKRIRSRMEADFLK